MSINYLTAPLETLTLTQLFARQAQAGTTHERALACRNQHPTISAEWDMWNAVLTGSMQDLADIAAAITTRIADMAAETGTRPLHHVAMACTTCGAPVRPSPVIDGRWVHKTGANIVSCAALRGDSPVKARVDA
jgi:hypothetical protein